MKKKLRKITRERKSAVVKLVRNRQLSIDNTAFINNYKPFVPIKCVYIVITTRYLLLQNMDKTVV